MLRVRQLSCAYRQREVLREINLDIDPGQTLAIIGESGAGKSTLLKALLGLVPLSSGEVSWRGQVVLSRCRTRPAWPNQDCALVMQEPRAALNPRMTLLDSVQEPLRARNLPLCPSFLNSLLQALELDRALLNRTPSQISIGQAQRICIARALINRPALLLFDEPLSALDAAIQKHTAQLMARLQKELNLTYLVVTHDLGYAAAYATHIAVMQQGKFVERCSAETFFREPRTLYGQSLVASSVALGALKRSVA